MDKNHFVIAEFSIVPIGTGDSSVSRYVVAAVKAFKNIEGLGFRVNSHGNNSCRKRLRNNI